MRYFLIFTVLLLASCAKNQRDGTALPKIGEVDFDALQLKSLARLNEIITNNPISDEALYKRAKILASLGRNSEAFKDIEQALTLEPNRQDYIFLKSEIQYNLKLLKEAIQTAEIAAGAGLESPLFYLHLSKLYLEVDSLKLAEQYIDETLMMVPEFAQAWQLKGSLLMKYDSLNAAFRLLNKALALDEENPDAYDYLAKAYLKEGKLDSAGRINEKGFKYLRKNQTHVGLLYNRGKVVERLGKQDSALKIYDEILTISPSASFVNEDIGDINLKNGNFTKAYESFKLEIDKSSKKKNIYLRAGYCLERLYRNKEAQELYLKAQKVFPQDEEVKAAFDRITNLIEREYRSTGI